MTTKFRDELGYFTVEGIKSAVYIMGKYEVLFEDGTEEIYENAMLVEVYNQ